MTTIASPDVATERLQAAVERYRNEGYRVTVAPSGNDLPDFLRRFSPDLLAVNDRENIVVVVKRRDRLTEEFVELSAAIDSHPGWRLDLWFVPMEIHREILDPQAEVDAEQVHQSLARARAMEHADLALVIAWGALELSMIHAARVYEVEIPSEVMGTVVSIHQMGLISYEEYKMLRDAWDARARIIHGYTTDVELQPLVDRVISVAEQLITNAMTA
jgi:hypothetical protein